MRCVRFEDLKTGFIGIGFINGDSITRVQGSLETYWQITEDVYRMDEVRLLAPCVPKQIICVSLNFRKRANEFGLKSPCSAARLRIQLSVLAKKLFGLRRWRSWRLAWS